MTAAQSMRSWRSARSWACSSTPRNDTGPRRSVSPGARAHQGRGYGRNGMNGAVMTFDAGAFCFDLATIFSTPPRALGPGPQAGMDYSMAYDFDRDPAAIHAGWAAIRT